MKPRRRPKWLLTLMVAAMLLTSAWAIYAFLLARTHEVITNVAPAGPGRSVVVVESQLRDSSHTSLRLWDAGRGIWLWSRDLDGVGTVASLRVHDARAVLRTLSSAGRPSRVLSYALEDGTQKWQRDVDEAIAASWDLEKAGDQILLHDGIGLTAVDSETGVSRWVKKEPVFWSGQATGGMFVFRNGSATMTLDARTGELRTLPGFGCMMGNEFVVAELVTQGARLALRVHRAVATAGRAPRPAVADTPLPGVDSDLGRITGCGTERDDTVMYFVEAGPDKSWMVRLDWLNVEPRVTISPLGYRRGIRARFADDGRLPGTIVDVGQDSLEVLDLREGRVLRKMALQPNDDIRAFYDSEGSTVSLRRGSRTALARFDILGILRGARCFELSVPVAMRQAELWVYDTSWHERERLPRLTLLDTHNFPSLGVIGEAGVPSQDCPDEMKQTLRPQWRGAEGLRVWQDESRAGTR